MDDGSNQARTLEEHGTAARNWPLIDRLLNSFNISFKSATKVTHRSNSDFECACKRRDTCQGHSQVRFDNMNMNSTWGMLIGFRSRKKGPRFPL